MITHRRVAIGLVTFMIITIVLLTKRSDIQTVDYIPKLPTLYNGWSNRETAEISSICRSHHAALYEDVESTEAYWNRVGGMSRADLEQSRFVCERDGNCPIMKLYNGQLYIREPIARDLSYQSRAHDILLLLNRIDLSFHENADFLIDTNDGTRLYEPCFLEMDKHYTEKISKSREESINHFLLPDFTTYDWWESRLPPFTEARLTLAEASGPFSNKIAKLFWRGVTLLQQGTQRTDLVNQLGPKTDVADVAAIHPGESPNGHKGNLRTLAEMCQYQYILYTEGVAYSGRLKYTSMCNSVQIGHKITYYEFWTHLIKPYYVEVSDWDDALRKYKELRADPGRAAALAKGARDVIREQLSPTGISCYVKRMLEGYARSIRWQVLSPQEDNHGQTGDGEFSDKFSWIPLEHFLAKMSWMGTRWSSENSTKPIEWSY